MRRAAFSKYLAYQVGGAELSLLEQLRRTSGEEDQVTLISCRNARGFGALRPRQDIPRSWEVQWLSALSFGGRFPFSEYALNRAAIARSFAGLEADELWAQNIWAPAALRGFQGRKVLFLRDEIGLGVWRSYATGLRRVLAAPYRAAEWAGFSLYRKDLVRALAEADRVVANSMFIARLCAERYGREAEVVYPMIDAEGLRARFEALRDRVAPQDRGVVLIGADVVKGVQVFERLAHRFPNERFYAFARGLKAPEQRGAVRFLPWRRDPAEAYVWAKVVLAPSIWDEAFGRAPAEAIALGLPVIVSDRGGLPEAVGFDEARIARSEDEFAAKLSRLL